MSTAASVELLTVEETAAMLKRSTAALRYMIHAGTAPKSATIGRRRVFRRSDVEEFIAAVFNDSQARAEFMSTGTDAKDLETHDAPRADASITLADGAFRKI